MLPLLFHVNDPTLPGYVSADTPLGISNYHIDDATLAAVNHLLRGVDAELESPQKAEIHSLYLMGSCGTIAHSSLSDYDIWLCHAPTLTSNQLDMLRSKAAKIEQWANIYGLEVHFFLMNAEHFRQGHVEELSSESSGTAQHHLLLDEFYRTALLMAGRIPTWWLVPPGREKEYDAYVAELVESCDPIARESIDFGGLGHMPAEEFFGAAVWQLYKAIDSPHKSVLKILLMEAYAHQFPDVDFLCVAFKRSVYTQACDVDNTDPYIMLLDRLSQYLESSERADRLQLIRRCFYFKTGIPLTRVDFDPGSDWQKDLLLNLVSQWRWGDQELSELDNQEQWNINQIIRERKLLINELRHSYFALSDFAREHAGLAAISQNDLNLLGRKLYAAFDKTAGKILIINRGFKTDLHESAVKFVQHSLQAGGRQWYVCRHGSATNEIPDNNPIERGASAVELLIWAFFNRIVDSQTGFSLATKLSYLSSRELSEITTVLEDKFPHGNLTSVTMEDYAAESCLKSVQLFINIDVNPASIIATSGGHDIQPDNVLKASEIGENLMRSIDAVFSTSHQEVFVHHYTGTAGLLDCLCAYLSWTPLENTVVPANADAFCFAHPYGGALAKSVSSLFGDVGHCFLENPEAPEAPRYIIAIENRFAINSLLVY